ncbi:hypothetical protein RSOL_432970, partial [Rhizoctonia solani AG-3 Rhs1AP]
MLDKFGPYVDDNESDSDTSSGDPGSDLDSDSGSDSEGWTDTDLSEDDPPILSDEGAFVDYGSDSDLD